MNTDKKVCLEFKCPIQFSELEKKGEQFHCFNCSKNLVDFRTSEVDKIHEYYHKAKDKTCGIFKKSQLRSNFLKTSLATLIVTSLTTYHTYGQEIEVENDDKTSISCTDADIFLGIIIEKHAEPVGGIKKFFDELSKEIQYPKNINKYGRVFVEFEIDTTGKMINLKVVRGLETNTNKETLRAIKALNQPFTPAEQRGKKVKSKMVFPIIFKEPEEK